MVSEENNSSLLRYKVVIAYDGTGYAGWQVQHNALAIQPIVQKAIETVLRHPIALTGSSRTDAGVHALCQTAHFETPLSLKAPPSVRSFNALLPPQIRILSIHLVPATFHARYAVVRKTYAYHFDLGPTPNPFRRPYSYYVPHPIDRETIREAIPSLLGTHDFIAFANQAHKGIAARDSIRTLFRIEWSERDNQARLEFEGDGFLYKMVRNLTGTLLEIGLGKLPKEAIPAILEGKDRRRAGSALPAHGLFLLNVEDNHPPLQERGHESRLFLLPSG